MIARVAETAFILFVQRRIRLEVRARDVIQEHIEGGIEQIPPTPHQVIEHCRLVRQQPVVSGVERVNVSERRINAQQIAGCGGAQKHLGVQLSAEIHRPL
jgi:hypothetical protein